MILSQKGNKWSSQKYAYDAGAAFIEFLLSAILFFGLLGAIIDVGLGLFHANLINKSTLNASREVAMNYTMNVVPSSCSELDEIDGSACSALSICAQNYIKDILNETHPGLAPKTLVSATLSRVEVAGAPPFLPGDPAEYELNTTATYKSLCVFCGFLPHLGTYLGNQVRMQRSITCS